MRIIRYSYPNTRNLALNRNAFARSPWAGFETEIDRLFETALGDFSGNQTSNTRFPVDVYQDKERLYVRAELPGFNREDLDIEVVDGTLTIQANRKTPTPATGEATEKDQAESPRPLSRSLELPEDVQVDAIAATYENGVLNLSLPKREEVKPKKITVSVN